VLRMIASVSCMLLSCSVLGCGSTKPSDRNVEDAVKRYYSRYEKQADADRHGGIHLPKGTEHGVENVQVTEVRCTRCGGPFSPNNFQQMRRPFGANPDGFPVRVFVKGTLKRQIDDSNEPFDGEADFILYFVPPDKSRGDTGPGMWVAAVP
jgi:hypothetical protein